MFIFLQIRDNNGAYNDCDEILLTFSAFATSRYFPDHLKPYEPKGKNVSFFIIILLYVSKENN